MITKLICIIYIIIYSSLLAKQKLESLVVMYYILRIRLLSIRVEEVVRVIDCTLNSI